MREGATGRAVVSRRVEGGAVKWVYDFSEGSREMRDLLGGKGANLAEMVRVLGAELVPAGFTITTEACVAYMEAGGTPPPELDAQVDEAVARLEASAGRGLGDPDEPLLVSSSEFENALREMRSRRGVDADTGLDANDLRELEATFQRIFEHQTGDPFPQEPRDQLRQAITAVFDSWNGERAVAYRRINGIPDHWGTAVNVQQMVFGNKGEQSGSGVAFSRDERTGEPTPSGDFLGNAQGEDVVAGIRNPQDIH